MKDRLRIVASYAIVVVIALMMALNYQLFVFPNSFAPAGLNGALTMIQQVFNFKLSHSSIILNIPLAIASFFINSRPRALRTLTYSLSFSLFLILLDKVDLTPFVYSTTTSTLLGPLVAGLITGFGGYVMHKVNACYGGTEFIAGFIHRYNPGFNFFNIIFVLNITVAIASYFVYGYKIEPVLLCIIYSYASSTVRDVMNRRHESAVRCEVITEYPDEINQGIINELHHTSTVLQGKGAYAGGDKSVLICVINSAQVAELTRIVSKYPDSFVVVSNAVRVLGNFKRLDKRGRLPVKLYDGGIPTKK